MRSLTVIFLGLFALCEVEAFVRLDHSNRNARLPISSLAASSSDSDSPTENARRQAVDRLVTFTGAAAASVLLAPSYASALTTDAATSAATEKEGAMYSPKFVQTYDDFKESPEGWSYREVTAGKGESAAKGDRVVYDWSGYTIGYFGRPFQAKGGPQGGAFDKDIDFERTVLGSGQIVQGVECALNGMKQGEVRQVVVPFGALSYPADDAKHDRIGPKPSTFSGQRALNFVLENPRVDRTLLFNVKVVRVDKPNGKGGFSRGD